MKTRDIFRTEIHVEDEMGQLNMNFYSNFLTTWSEVLTCVAHLCGPKGTECARVERALACKFELPVPSADGARSCARIQTFSSWIEIGRYECLVIGDVPA